MVPLPINFLNLLSFFLGNSKLMIKVNRTMKIISHITTIALPLIFLVICYSMFLLIFNYFMLLFNLMIRSYKSIKNLTHFILFIFVGPFQLIYLSVLDVFRVGKILFLFDETDFDLYWNPQEPKAIEQSYLLCYSNFSSVCKKIMSKKEQKKMVKISEIIQEMEIYLKHPQTDDTSLLSGAFSEKRKRKKDNLMRMSFQNNSLHKEIDKKINLSKI